MQQICILASCLGVPLAGRVLQDRRLSGVPALKESPRPGDPFDPSLRHSGYQGGRPSPGSSARWRHTFLGSVALQSSGVLVLAWSISPWGAGLLATEGVPCGWLPTAGRACLQFDHRRGEPSAPQAHWRQHPAGHREASRHPPGFTS